MKSQLTTILSVEEIRFGPVGLFFLDFCLHHHPHDSSKGQLPCKVVASNFVAHHHFIEPLNNMLFNPDSSLHDEVCQRTSHSMSFE